MFEKTEETCEPFIFSFVPCSFDYHILCQCCLSLFLRESEIRESISDRVYLQNVLAGSLLRQGGYPYEYIETGEINLIPPY